MASADNPENSPILRWIRDHLDYPHKDYCLIWPFNKRAGYGALIIDGKAICAHRYICELVNGPAPAGYVASHSCDRGHDACVNHHHLSWQTNSENQLRRKDHKDGPRFKLNWGDVETIRRLKGVETPVDTAKRFGVSESAIRQVQSGKTWKSRSRLGNSFTDAQVQTIRSLQGAKSAAKVGAEFGVSGQIVYRIWKRLNWAHIPEATHTIG